MTLSRRSTLYTARNLQPVALTQTCCSGSAVQFAPQTLCRQDHIVLKVWRGVQEVVIQLRVEALEDTELANESFEFGSNEVQLCGATARRDASLDNPAGAVEDDGPDCPDLFLHRARLQRLALPSLALDEAVADTATCS